MQKKRGIGMTTRQCTLLLIGVCLISALVGCGGGGSGSGTTPPTITVTFNPAPPASVQVNSKTDVTAIVTNDTTGDVNWSCTPVNSCGSFSPAQTLSGISTTYTAPATVPSGGKVTVIATSVADSSASASATIAIISVAPITVTFKPAPPSSLQINATSPLTANVANDPRSAGVNWTCTPTGSCGSFSPTQTHSGIPTTYTAPSSIPSGGSVTVTATSVSDSFAFDSASIGITPPQISVSFDPQPPPFLLVDVSTPITAVVAFDPTHAGVDWTCAPANSCGSFNPAHTTSNVPTVYTAPATAGPVNITASSTAGPTHTARTTIAVAMQFGNAALNGNYVFEANGKDSFAHAPPGVYQVAGVLQADGNGNLLGGELLYEDQPGQGNELDAITGGTYTVGVDGRGTIAVNTGDTSIGVNGVLTFSVAMLSGTTGLITQFDSSATSRGTLDLQTSSSASSLLSGGYAFATSGVDGGANNGGAKEPMGMGGILNVDSPGGISGTGTILDVNDNGTLSKGVGLSSPGSVTAPDLFGKVVVNIDPAFPNNPQLTFVGFIVDDTHVKLIERDHNFGITAGAAFSQGNATGTFKSNAAFHGSFVYGAAGFSTANSNTLQPTVYAGEFTANGAGGLTNGYADENAGGIITTGALSGNYTVQSSGTGRVTTNTQFNGVAGPSLVFYLTNDAAIPALSLQLDSSPFNQTAGALYTQTSALGVSSFSGNYGLGFAAFPGIVEDNGTGQVTADGNSSLSGTADLNIYPFTPNPNTAFSGTFTASGMAGRFTGTLTAGTVFAPASAAYYLVDATRVLFVEIDSQAALGTFRQQQSAGAAPISVSFNPPPPSSVQVSSQTNITALVVNDPNNAGVNWTVTCTGGSCGSFNPTQTASGVPTVYTAPAAPPSGGTVTVTATSVTDNTKFASAQITITTTQITVSFSQPPPASLAPNATSPITAVTNDPSGVNWTCTPLGSCGSFNPAQTLSGIPTTYTAPGTLGTVTVIASSVTEPSVNAQAQIQIENGPPPIVVVFDPQPPPFLFVNAVSPLTALVINDGSNAGVDWTCTPTGTCGSFNPAHTASGGATNYTAPASPTAVTITAASHANSGSVATANVTVATQFGVAALNGNYVFEASGRDAFSDVHVPPGAYQIAGVLQGDGNGNIIGGELLYEDQPGTHGNALDNIIGGTYSIGATDGRGTITLSTNDTTIGVNGVLTFSLAMLSGSHGLITQFDTSASSTGTLDLQTTYSATNLLSGGYAFISSGVDSATEGRFPLGMGGVFNVDGVGTISGSGTVMDLNDNGVLTTGALLTTAGTAASPDQFGKVVVNLNPAFPGSPAITLAGFILDDTHIKLIERDHTFAITGGVAYAQGGNTGTFINNSHFNSTVVYSTTGYSTVSGSTEQPTVYAGEFTANGSGSLTNGYTDESQFGVLTSDTLTGSYAVDSTGTGRVTTSNMFYGSSGPGPSWIFYLTGASDAPALVLQVNGSTHGSSNYIETAGIAYTQASGPPGVSSFTGPYGIGFSYFPPLGGEDDGTGQIRADGVGNLTPGTDDANVCVIGIELCTSFDPMQGLTLSGTFNNSGVPGRFAGTLNDNTIFNFDPIAFYIADGTRVLFVDMGATPAVGAFNQQQ